MRNPFVTDIDGEVFKIRFADEKDIEAVLNFIRELAEYEGMLELVTATKEILHDSLFVRKSAEVIIGEYNGQPVGFVLFFHNFSTFLGKAGLYLEDLYIKQEMRGKGFGKMMFSFLAEIAEDRGCGRLEWWCLNWNKPSIKFYENMGAEAMKDWTVYRLTKESFATLIK